MKWQIFFYCITLINCVLNVELRKKTEDKSKPEEDVFIPTNEWQVVKKGTSQIDYI